MKSNYELFGREHREGWNALVDKLISDLNEINRNWEISQIKEKFGGLRFYAHNCTKEQHDLIEKAEKESYKICEVCGKEGTLRDDLGWIQTLCDLHYSIEIMRRNEFKRKMMGGK